MSTRQTGTGRVGRLLLRSIHTLNSARAHPTACRGRLGYLHDLHHTNLPHKRRVGSAPFPFRSRTESWPTPPEEFETPARKTRDQIPVAAAALWSQPSAHALHQLRNERPGYIGRYLYVTMH